MADSASEIDLESDTSSVDGNSTFAGGGGRERESTGSTSSSIIMADGNKNSNAENEQLLKRLESLRQENRVLKCEVDTFKLKCKQLQEDNRELRKASVSIQAKAEQEEEFISNTLLKKIDKLKKEKETLAMNYEQEEEYLTNDLSRKLLQLRQEKAHLEETLEREQEFQVNKLMRKIEKLESETMNKQITLEQLRREKIELENALEQEQESLVNRLWKRMEKLEAEKRMLQEKLNEPVSAPPSPRDALMLDASTPPPSGLNTAGHSLSGSGGMSHLGPLFPGPGAGPRERRHSSGSSGPVVQHPFAPPGTRVTPGNINRFASMPPPLGPDEATAINLQTAGNLTQHIQNLRNEVHRLREGLRSAQKEHTDKMAQFMQEEKNIREENLRLQRKLQLETERRDNLCRHLSESESSLEMDEERHFHEMATGHPLAYPTSPALSSSSIAHHSGSHRTRTASSPIPYSLGGAAPGGGAIGNTSRPLSPAGSLGTSIPKTGAALMEATVGAALSTSASSHASGTSVPHAAPALSPSPAFGPQPSFCSSRCPNCGVLLSNFVLGGVSPCGGPVLITPASASSLSTAPTSVSLPSAGGDAKPPTGMVTSPPVAFVRPQAVFRQSGGDAGGCPPFASTSPLPPAALAGPSTIQIPVPPTTSFPGTSQNSRLLITVDAAGAKEDGDGMQS